MKVLIIGSTGQLACSLREVDTPVGMELVFAGRPDIDLGQPESLERLFARNAPDVVVNAAAYTAVDRSESEKDIAFVINSEGPAHLARLCTEQGVPFVHISTDYVFDGLKDSPYLEGDSVAPTGVYGRSKLEGERAVAKICPRHIILRTAWVYSPFGHNFVKTMLKLGKTRDEISVVSDQTGNPTYAPHLAKAILEIIVLIMGRKQNRNFWGTYHATASGEASWCDFAREIFEQSIFYGGPVSQVQAISTKDYPTLARRPVNSRLDCSKLENTFNINLPDWRQGVQECVKKILRGS